MMLSALKDDYLKQLTTQGYSPGTITYRRCYLEQFLAFKETPTSPQEMTTQLIGQYQRQLISLPLSTLTIHSKLSVLHLFLSWLLDQHYIIADLAAVVEFPKCPSLISQSILTEKEMRYLLSLPDIHTRKGIRDKAIMELLYSCAIRRNELVSLNIYDLDAASAMLKVKGKGAKERMLPIGHTALFWVIKYLSEVRKNTSKDKALFLGFTSLKRFIPQRLNAIIQDYARRSKLPKKITPHTFRHSCATHLMQNGADIRYIQQLLGHKSVATTQIYTRVTATDLAKVFAATHPRAKRSLSL